MTTGEEDERRHQTLADQVLEVRQEIALDHSGTDWITEWLAEPPMWPEESSADREGE